LLTLLFFSSKRKPTSFLVKVLRLVEEGGDF
jgi:hypothetical protein